MIGWRKMSQFTKSAALGIFLTILMIFPMKMKSQGFAVYGQVTNSQGRPAAYATIQVCPYTGSGIPCSPLSSLYSNLALTTSIPNPYTTDGNGNYSFFVSSNSTYILQVNVSGSVYSYFASAGNGGGGTSGCTSTSLTSGYIPFVSGTPCVFANSPLDYGASNAGILTTTAPLYMPTGSKVNGSAICTTATGCGGIGYVLLAPTVSQDIIQPGSTGFSVTTGSGGEQFDYGSGGLGATGTGGILLTDNTGGIALTENGGGMNITSNNGFLNIETSGTAGGILLDSPGSGTSITITAAGDAALLAGGNLDIASANITYPGSGSTALCVNSSGYMGTFGCGSGAAPGGTAGAMQYYLTSTTLGGLNGTGVPYLNGASAPTMATTSQLQAAISATGGQAYVPTIANSGFAANEVATLTGMGGGLGTTGIYMPASIIPAGGTAFLQIAAGGVISSIAGITAACGGPVCSTQQLNFAPCPTLTTLSASITSSQTTGITVTSATCLSPFGGILADNNNNNAGTEYIAYTSISGTTLVGVTRAFWGSAGATHASGTTVVQMQEVYSLDATSVPTFIQFQSGSIWYNPPSGGFSATALTNGLTQFGANTTFTSGLSVNTTGIFTTSTTTLFYPQSSNQNPGAGGAVCNTSGEAYGISSGTYSWWSGVAGQYCTLATNNLAPSTWGIVASEGPGTTPVAGEPFGYSLQPISNDSTTQGTAYSTGVTVTPLVTPVAPTGTPSTTGGTLAAGTYVVSIEAIDGVGNVTATGPTASFTTTGTTGAVALSWPIVGGAASYNVWLSTGQYFNTTTPNFQLTTATGTGGTPPTVNTTGKTIVKNIAINGGTPITSQSSANSQVVTCPTGGTTTQVCDAAGAWITPSGSGGTVTTSGSPASPNIAAFSSPTAITAATSANMQTTIGAGVYDASGTAANASNITSGTVAIARLPTGTTSSTVVVGGTIAAAGPIGSATAIPVLTYNAAGQLTTVTTVTPTVAAVSGKALTGSGAAIPTGPTSSVSGDLVSFTGTAGQVADSGVATSNVPLLNAANTFTATNTFTSGGVANSIILIQGGPSQGAVQFSTTPAYNIQGGADYTGMNFNIFFGTFTFTGGMVKAPSYGTSTNCSSSASPAVCGSAAAGNFVIAASATTLTINTTAVTANSQIIMQGDESLGTKLGVTCNTTITSLLDPVVTARVPGTSFSIATSATIAVNPACFSYAIIN